MMTEQRLQEIERDNARIECPDCGGMGKFGPIDEDMDEDKCEACDGTGNCSRFPATGELIAEVRRLQEQATLTGAALLDIRHQREAERDAVEAWQQERDAALAERDALKSDVARYLSQAAAVEERCSFALKKLAAERDAARAVAETLATSPRPDVTFAAGFRKGRDEEREACAREVEEYRAQMGNFWSPLDACDAIAAAIRARGGKP